MATRTVIPVAATEAPCVMDAETASARPASAHSYKNLSRSFGVLGFFTAAATVEALIPKYRFLLWQLPFFVVPTIVSLGFNYLRDRHPERVPVVLAPDAPLLLRLNGIKKALGWTAFALTVLGVAGLYASSVTESCSCETHPVIFIAWLIADISSYLGFVVLSTYLRERSEVPLVSRVQGRSRALTKRHFSEFKPLHSDHWGQRVIPNAECE